VGEQVLDDADEYLRTDFQRGFVEHVQRVGHDAVGGVLDRHDAVVGPVPLHLAEDLGDGTAVVVERGRAEPLQGRHLREGPRRPPVSDGHGFLEGDGGRDDLAEDRKQRVFRQRAPAVQCGQTQELVPLTLGREVARALVGHLLPAHFQRNLGALIEQGDKLGINGVYLLSQVLKAHGFLVRREK